MKGLVPTDNHDYKGDWLCHSDRLVFIPCCRKILLHQMNLLRPPGTSTSSTPWAWKRRWSMRATGPSCRWSSVSDWRRRWSCARTGGPVMPAVTQGDCTNALGLLAASVYFYHLLPSHFCLLGLIYIQLCNYLLPVSRCVLLHTPVSAMMQDPGAREPKSCLLGHDWASPSPPAQQEAQHSHPEVDRLQNFWPIFSPFLSIY